MIRTVLALMLVWLFAAPAQAAVFFDSDFEIGGPNDWAANGWNDFGTAPTSALMTMDSTQKFSGLRSLRLKFDGDLTADTAAINKSLATQETHLFSRFMARQKPGWIMSPINNQSKIYRWRSSGGYPILWMMNLGGVYGAIIEGPYSGGTITVYTGIQPSTTSWDTVEVEFKLNTPGVADGILRIWINNILRAERLNGEFKGPTPTSTNPSGAPAYSTGTLSNTHIYLQSGAGEMYYDRFAVGSTRIGPVGGGAGDTTPPATPTNWTIH